MKSHHNWPRLIEEQPHSGKTIAEFCAERGVSASSFYAARARLPGPGYFRPVSLADPENPSRLDCNMLSLRIGAVALEVQRGFDPVLLRAVVAALS
jgi:hypothetical protein